MVFSFLKAPTNRRDMLRIGGVALISGGMLSHRALAHLATPHGATERAASGKIGLEAISIMRPLAIDPAAALRETAAIGYRAIQTIGSLGMENAALADLLAGAGLNSPAMHICPSSFYRTMLEWDAGRMSMPQVFEQIQTVYALDRMPALIDEAIITARALGQRTLIWSNFLDTDLATTQGVRRIAAALNRGGRQCADAGLTLGFHNGSKGFIPIDGKKPYDIILDETDPALVKGEMDVYWGRKVGIDPLGYIAAHPGRYILVHLKDMDAKGDIVGVGQGVIDFSEVFAVGDKAGISHYFVEYDKAPEPIENIRSAWTVLSRIKN